MHIRLLSLVAAVATLVFSVQVKSASTQTAQPKTGQVTIGAVSGKDLSTTGFCSPIILVNSGNFTLICDMAKAGAIQLLSDQINKLYSPLDFELVEGDAEWAQFQHMFQSHFGRRSPLLYAKQIVNGAEVVVPVPLAPGEWSVWIDWVARAFVPRNDRIDALLRNNEQLVVGGTLSSCMKAFVAYKEAFDHNREEAMEHAGQRSWPVEQNWPSCFTDETEQTLRALEARRARLLAENE